MMFVEYDFLISLTSPCPEYYEISKLNKLLNSSDSSRNCLILFHCNIRSLPKNLPILKDWLYSLEKKADVLAISETNVLKVSRVTPIFKSDDATDPAIYRPIAVFSPFSKILEKIVNDQLISFIDKFKHQFGFRKDHSTELAIDKNLITCGVFLDFFQSF